MIKRPSHINALEKALNRTPVASLLGPRQCGKTTLARIFEKKFNATFFDLESFQLPIKPILLLTGSILLFITILLFFLNILKSEQIINLKTYFPLYVALGYLFFLLSTTPIDIYIKYYDIDLNESYVNLRASIYLYINLFLYSTITLGFILCFWKKKSY